MFKISALLSKHLKDSRMGPRLSSNFTLACFVSVTCTRELKDLNTIRNNKVIDMYTLVDS